MAKLTWYNHEDMLFEAHQDVVLAMLEKNREEARKIAFEEDSERVSQAEKRSKEKHKKYRLARSQARKRDENMRIQKEGTTYEAGAFNL